MTAHNRQAVDSFAFGKRYEPKAPFMRAGSLDHLIAGQPAIGPHCAVSNDFAGHVARQMGQIDAGTRCVMSSSAATPDRFNRHSVLRRIEEVQHPGVGIVPQFGFERTARRCSSQFLRVPVGQRGEAGDVIIPVVANAQLHGIGAVRTGHNARIGHINFPIRGRDCSGTDYDKSKNDRRKAVA